MPVCHFQFPAGPHRRWQQPPATFINPSLPVFPLASLQQPGNAGQTVSKIQCVGQRAHRKRLEMGGRTGKVAGENGPVSKCGC